MYVTTPDRIAPVRINLFRKKSVRTKYVITNPVRKT
jgi:hypothetical protein